MTISFLDDIAGVDHILVEMEERESVSPPLLVTFTMAE